MIEVEAKVKISNPSFFREKIKKFAGFIGKITKIDDYYSLENVSNYPRKSLRVRKIGTSYKINFKQKLSYIKGIHAKVESEFNVSDIKNFIGLIKDFGFKKWLRKEKHSEIYQVEKNFNIELNKVKGLGWFLEIEILTNKRGIEKARKKILKIVKKISIKEKEIIKAGYTKLLWNKKIYEHK